MALTCRTCGGAPGHHRPSMLDPSGVGDPGHRMTGSKPCETCGGDGYFAITSTEPDCPTCNGTGVQSTPPSTEDELEPKVTFEVDGEPATLQEFMSATVLAETLRKLKLGIVTVEDAFKTIRREQHRHTAEVLKTIRSAAGIDGSALAHMNMLDAAIAAEEQAMKGESDGA